MPTGAHELTDVVAALKAARAELDRLKALSAAPRTQQRPAKEPITKRAERMRELLAKGGEFA